MAKVKKQTELAESGRDQERIVVENFGPLKNVDLTLKPINIFIGESGVGKSYLAKLIFCFRESIIIPVFDLLEGLIPLSRLQDSIKERIGRSISYITKLENIPANITYYIDNNRFFKVDIKKTNTITFSQHLDLKLKEIISKYPKNEKTHNSARNSEVKKLFGMLIPGYIPAGRSSILLISNIAMTILSEPRINIDHFIKMFAKDYEENRNMLFSNSKGAFNKKTEEYLQRVFKLLKGEYKIINGEERFYVSKREYLDLLQISSGQQELIPALVVLIGIIENGGVFLDTFIFFEEPEAHIYPSTQKELLELLVLFHKIRKNNKMIITTHSPYILTALNNLIQADNTFKKRLDLKEKIEKIIPSDRWVSFEDVGVYYFRNPEEVMKGESSIRSLMDNDNRIINAEEIDKVSDVIGEQFNKLLDIEFGDK